MTRATRVVIGGIAVLAVGGYWASRRFSAPPKPIATPTPATQAAPATRPAITDHTIVPPPPTVSTVLGVLQRDNPSCTITAPLDLPSDLMDAAKIVLHRPTYVDPLGNLWITHPHGKPSSELLTGPIPDHTAITTDPVGYVEWPTTGDAGHAVGNVNGGDLTRAVPVPGGVVVPTRTGIILLTDKVTHQQRFELPRDAGDNAVLSTPALAPSLAGVWVWSPWDTDRPGSRSPIFIDSAGIHVRGADEGFPDHIVEIVPLADDSVLVLYDGDDGPALKLIAAKEKPPSSDVIATITALAQQLADPEPLKRDAATRALEAQGPAAYPVLESLREQLPAEAQVRIENLLGQRFAPTLGGLRPGPGKVHTLARFPGGGCVLQFDGGGTVGGIDENDPPRSVIPATVLIRPGHPIELIDPKAVTDFVEGRQTIQSIGE